MGNAIITCSTHHLAIMIGALAMVREFVKESEVFKRERCEPQGPALRAVQDVVAVLLALYQALVYTAIHHLAFNMPAA